MPTVKNKSDNVNNDPKVMDVAKPGTTDPDTGSKPMVVGHKSLVSDPTIKKAELEKSDDDSSGDVEVKVTPAKKLIIQPISYDEEEATQKPDEKPISHVDELEGHAEPSEVKQPEADTTQEEPKKSVEDIEKDRLTEIDDRENNLQKLVKSQEYRVAINESSHSASAMYLKVFIVTALVGLIVLAVLADMDMINLGFDLPFDIL